jgi:antitoxin CptB
MEQMAEAKRLAWLCRRGARELDMLLQGYLKEVYPRAPERHQNAFRRLLEHSDPELQSLILHEGTNGDKDILEVSDSIRAHYMRHTGKN